MSEQDSSQEKTEEATPRQIQKSREEGQVPRSRELSTTAVLMAGALGLWVFGGMMGDAMMAVMRANFRFDRRAAFDENYMFAHLGASFSDMAMSSLPVLLLTFFAAAVSPILIGGWLFSSKSLMPKLNRLNPLEGIKRMFSSKSLVELLKAIAKVLLVGGVAFLILSAIYEDIYRISQLPLRPAIVQAMTLVALAAIGLCATTILIAIVDVPFQIWEHAQKLKMTMQQVKDEMKETEGKPEVKGRVRQLQRQYAEGRMMSAVPEADVVITNPTHYSVAIQYKPESMAVPVVLAKGADHLALKIREIAKANEVMMMETPPLARALYHTTEPEQEIPAGLYLAVAQVLAYVFQLRQFHARKGPRPKRPTGMKIPPDMRFDD